MTIQEEPIRINKHNFEQLVPNSPISFATLTAAAYCPYNMMKGQKTFTSIRYLTYDELTTFMKNRIKRTGAPTGAKAITTVTKAQQVIDIIKKMQGK